MEKSRFNATSVPFATLVQKCLAVNLFSVVSPA